MRRKLLLTGFLFCALALASLLIAVAFLSPGIQADLLTTIIPISVIGWLVVAWLMLREFKLNAMTLQHARPFGIDGRFDSVERVFEKILEEIDRKNDCLSLNLVQQRVTSKRDLSRALERIVGLAYRLLSADSAELALFDDETGLYHSALVLGKPFRVSAQSMLSDATKGEAASISPDVIVQPVAFAGSVLGTLRVSLKKGRIPSVGDREIMALLALQAGLALMNAQYSDQVVRMKRANEESIRAKTGFLANLSHEIRGPLGIMLNAVELVLDGLCGEVTQDQNETLKMVQSNGEHLLELINDVLDYAKVESGRITPNKVPIVVNTLLKDIAAIIRSQAEAKAHKIHVRPIDDALVIALDRRHARQMLINLLTNAVKYTPDGGKIEIWAERSPGNKVKINIRDSGVGIEESDRHKVFAAFERIDNAYSINQVGTGLGMPLTKRLAEVNGGTIDFESTPGEGTHFWLVFPAAAADAAAIAAEEEAEKPPAEGKGECILLVEKDEGERKMIARYLKHLKFQVAAAGSKIEALELIRNKEIDLAIVGNDIADSPEEDLVSMIRDRAQNGALPVVLVSSRAFTFDVERYLKAGVDRCLSKPIELKELSIICRQLIDRTYTGEVIDTSSIREGNRGKEKKAKPSEPLTKVFNLTDITH